MGDVVLLVVSLVLYFLLLEKVILPHKRNSIIQLICFFIIPFLLIGIINLNSKVNLFGFGVIMLLIYLKFFYKKLKL